MHPSVPCPKCGRLLAPDGEIAFDDAIIPVYQCPECITRTMLGDEALDLPLTFIINADGRPFDPANPDGEIDLTEYE